MRNTLGVRQVTKKYPDVDLSWSTPWGVLPADGVVVRAVQQNMIQGLRGLAVVAVPGIRVTDGELTVYEAVLARSGLSHQRGALSV